MRPRFLQILAIGIAVVTPALYVEVRDITWNDLLVPAILMVVAISFGMAVAKSGIGVLAILGRQLVDRRLEGHEEKHHHFTNWSRIAGSAAVLLIGLGLFVVRVDAFLRSLSPLNVRA